MGEGVGVSATFTEEQLQHHQSDLVIDPAGTK